MFGISGTELLIVAVFGFLLFGPDKLPQMGRTLGRALRQFRETQEKLTAVVQTEVVDPMAAAAQKGAQKAGVAPADDSDADAAAASGEAAAPANPAAGPARKETFAERRARLAAEKAEAEAAKTAAAAEVASEGEGASDAASAEAVSTETAAPAADPVAPVAEAPAAPAAEPAAEEAPAVRTTEDLYARRPRKRKAVEAEAAEAADESVACVTDSAAAEGGEQ